MSFKNLKVKYLDSELTAEMKKLYPVRTDGFVKIGEKEWFLPYRYARDGDKIYSFKTRSDDIWVVTYGRSGTTLMQELVWLVVNDLNFEEALRTTLYERFPFIELGVIVNDMLAADTPDGRKLETNSVEFVRDLPSPRFIKTHMPFDLLPTVVNSDCKIVYVARNPKNVVISLYIFNKNLKYALYQGTFEQFCNDFMNDHALWSPYWEHVKDGWAMRHKPNVLFLFYEDLVKDLSESIKKVASFFDKTYSDEQIAKLADHLNIDNFRKNPMVNNPGPGSVIKSDNFIRQGKTGNWKEMFTPEIEERFSKWIADNLKDTDLIFPS